MADIDVQTDLNAVNDQIGKTVEELNKLTSARDQMIQQIQNLNGVAMYLRGKLPSEEQNQVGYADNVEEIEEATAPEETKDSISRSVEYP